MRRLLTLLALAAAPAALSSCGDGDEAGALDVALNYLPRDAAVVAVSTDFDDGQWEALDAQLAEGVFADPSLFGAPPASVEDLVREGFEGDESVDVSYEDDVEPLLGNPLAVGSLGRESLADPGPLLAALDTGEADVLEDFPDRLGMTEVGELEGATLYGFRARASMAVDGEVLVSLVGEGDERDLRAAIRRAHDGDGLTEEQFSETLDGLPDDALVRAYGDLAPVLESPELSPLRALPWVDALRTFGAAASLDEDEIVVDGVLNTDPSGLDEADLPFPADPTIPELVRREGEIAGASADQSRTTSFLLEAVRAALPDSRFVRDVARIERELGIDFERDVLAHFNGPSASSITLDGEFAARSEVEDPERLVGLMRRLAPDLGRLIQDLQGLRSEGLVALLLIAPDAPVAPRVLGESRIEVRPIPGEDELYELSNLRPPGGPTLPTPVPDRIVFGLVGDTFVVASDEERAREIAAAPAGPPPEGVEGASVVAGDAAAADELRETLAARGLDPGPLGELTASLTATTSELRGTVRVELPD